MAHSAVADISPDRRRGESWPLRWQRRGWTPPVSNPRFWATQALVVAIAALHDAIEVFGLLPWFGHAYFLPISMFFIPVVYAALYFGLSGALATSLWCTALSVPNWLFLHQPSESAGSMVQMAIINGMAVFVGIHSDQQTRARADAEAAGRAMQASEARYRELFQTSGEGILAVDSEGRIHECNTAAEKLLGIPAVRLRGMTLPAVLSAARSRKVQTRPGDLVVDGPHGEPIWLEPLTASLGDPKNGSQIVLRDVTDQRRRQLGLETYAAQVVRAQEEERKRLAHELHDDTVQSLVLLWRQLDGVAKGEGDQEHRAAALREARDFVGTIAESVRGYAQGLRPPILDDLGLVPALRRLLAELSDRSDMETLMEVRGSPRRLSSDIELSLYRITQESLRNAERHSGARNVHVTLQYDPADTTLTVRDDGRGIQQVPGVGDAGRMGLLGMQERARLHGGKVTIRSKANSGTTVKARIPVEPTTP